jgi:GNAT superfamily N-acetyltransferase
LNSTKDVRPATKDDIPGMHRVRLAVRENVLSDPNRITEQDYLAALEELGRTWVVEADGQITGFATGYKDGNIWALFVHPDYEGRGFAAALHSVMVDWLWSIGLTRLNLTTFPGTRAQRFYIARGWKPCGLAPNGDLRLELTIDVAAKTLALGI